MSDGSTGNLRFASQTHLILYKLQADSQYSGEGQDVSLSSVQTWVPAFHLI